MPEGRTLRAQTLPSLKESRSMGFGEVLRGHRRAARLTLEQLAEVSGVSARTLSDMERGRSRGPQHRTVTALADALVLEGDARKQFIELARDGRLRDHWTRPAGVCELPRLVEDFTAVPRSWPGSASSRMPRVRRVPAWLASSQARGA